EIPGKPGPAARANANDAEPTPPPRMKTNCLETAAPPRRREPRSRVSPCILRQASERRLDRIRGWLHGPRVATIPWSWRQVPPPLPKHDPPGDNQKQPTAAICVR